MKPATQMELDLAVVMIRAAKEYKADLKIRTKTATDPEKGTKKFFVINNRASVYTIIGADNRHHASNKATLLYKDKWDMLSEQKPPAMVFYSVVLFGKLVKLLP